MADDTSPDAPPDLRSDPDRSDAERSDPDPLSDQVRSGVLEDDEGDAYVVDQQNLGPAPDTDGGGEFPSPSAPPQAPAPGAA